jgi:hypothetical protein
MGRLRKALHEVTDKWFGGADAHAATVQGDIAAPEARKQATPSKRIDW